MPNVADLTREQCHARMEAINSELHRLERFDELTAPQQRTVAELSAEFAALEAHDDLLERGERLERIRAATTGASGGYRIESGAGDHQYPATGGGERRTEQSVGASREAGEARRVIDAAARSGQLPDHAAQRATVLVDTDPPANRGLAARWAAAAGDPDYLSAFLKLVSDPTRGHMLFTGPEHDAYRAVVAVQGEMRAMGIGTDAGGGFMVPMTLDPAIIITNAGSINPLRRVSRTVQTTSDQWSGVTSAGVTAAWYAEAAEVGDDSPTLAQPSIPVHRGSAFIPFSIEWEQDAMNAVQELRTLLIDGADRLMATAYTTGSGTGQPRGIITALAGTGSVVAPGTAETFVAGDVYRLIEALPPRWQPAARWQAALAIINRIDQFETTAGAKLFDLAGGSLLRKPLDENSDMDGTWDPAVTADNHVLLVGDFSQFLIVDRIGSTLELVPHLMGANRRPTGQRGAFLWFRTGSDVTTTSAFRVLNIATTL